MRSDPGAVERVDDAAEQRREQLVELYHEASGCTRCALSETRTRVVFGAGNSDAELIFVGEGPGAEEDRQGLPFVGRAGQLLNQLLEGIGLSREEVFVTNTVKCRPPGNRDPQPVELESCRPYLDGQLQLIRPKVIATLGNFATKLITGNQAGITKVRGTPQVHELAGRTVYVFPLLHPAAALRTPKMKELLVEDFGRLRELLDRPSPELPAATPGDAAPMSAEPPRAGPAEEVPGVPESAGAPPSRAPAEDQLDLFRR